MKKRALALVLTAAMVLGLTACGEAQQKQQLLMLLQQKTQQQKQPMIRQQTKQMRQHLQERRSYPYR